MSVTNPHIDNLMKLGESAMDAILGDSEEFVAKISLGDFETKLLPIIRGEQKEDLTVWLDVAKAWGNEIEVYENKGGEWTLAFTVPALSGRTTSPTVSTNEDSVSTAVENAIKQSLYTPMVADKQLLKSLDGRVKPDLTVHNLNLSRWRTIYERYNIEHNIPKIELNDGKAPDADVEYEYDEF